MPPTFRTMGAWCVLLATLFALPANANIFTCLFRGTGCPPGPSGKAGSGDVPQPVVAPPFVPTFVDAVANSPFGQGLVMNSDLFATPETAQALCKKLGCLFVFARPCVELQDPYSCSALQQFMTFPGCYTTNAGPLAAYFKRDRSPEDLYPNVAYNAVMAVMATDRAMVKPSCAPSQ